ncbi:MAG: replication-relaxation family protein [Chloroflexi bacterium]|nr:replication-relaxation family protein [Chloroflexota bacterium]
MSARRDLLRLLAAMPLLDRLEMVALSGWSRGAVYGAIAAQERAGLVDAVPHASGLTPATRRYCLTAGGLRRLAEENGSSVESLLRRRPVSEQWRRILLQRLDAVATVYRLASALSDAAYPIRLRWYRAMPMDAALALPDGRTLAVVRLGPTADRTAFAKRLWRLRRGPRPGAFLLVVPDEIRLRHTGRLMAGASAITFLALERDVAASGADARLWRSRSGPTPLSLREVLAHAGGGRSWPRERPLRRLTPPQALPETEAPTAPDWLLPASLVPAGKRVLDLVADWPWIAPPHLAALLGVSARRLGQALRPLEEARLVARAPARRLVLSDRGLAVLARRDRASVGLARKRWSAAPVDPARPLSWRNVSGRRNRQLLRNLEHTAAVHEFMATLAADARDQGHELVQLDPPHRASRFFRHEGRLHSVHPDAFGVLRLGGRLWPFFLEWERRAVRPATMAARLAPYLRYYTSYRPTDDHGVRPAVLVAFEDEIAASHFRGVARREVARASIDLPLQVLHGRSLNGTGTPGGGRPGQARRAGARLLPGGDDLHADHHFGDSEVTGELP